MCFQNRMNVPSILLRNSCSIYGCALITSYVFGVFFIGLGLKPVRKSSRQRLSSLLTQWQFGAHLGSNELFAQVLNDRVLCLGRWTDPALAASKRRLHLFLCRMPWIFQTGWSWGPWLCKGMGSKRLAVPRHNPRRRLGCQNPPLLIRARCHASDSSPYGNRFESGAFERASPAVSRRLSESGQHCMSGSYSIVECQGRETQCPSFGLQRKQWLWHWWIQILTVELNKKLTRPAVPHSHGTILSTSQDVILICINGCDCAAMRLRNFPKLGLCINRIKASQEAITIAR